jgi:L-lactate dehydrogenase complex protein LldE
VILLKTSLFITCIADNFFPEVGVSVVKILRKNGVDVDFPRQQTCCGQPAFNAGYWDEAKQLAKNFIRTFEKSATVVSPSGSCVAMIKHDYPLLFAGDPEWEARSKELGDKTYEFTQFLVNVLKIDDLGARQKAKVVYHPSCHATRLMEIREEPLKLLRQVRDLELLELPNAEQCCGFGGTFSVKMAAVSEEIVAEKVENILRSGADIVTGVDLGCLMNIGGRLQHQGHPVQARHIAQLLAEGMEA